MSTLEERLSALATRVGNVVRDGLASKANDADVVKLSGAQSINGVKTFGSAPQVPVGSLLANPVRRDDARLTDARTPVAHTHPGSEVTAAPRTVAYSGLSPLTAASGVALDVVTCSLTGNPTVSLVAGVDGQVVRLRLLAGSSARTVSIPVSASGSAAVLIGTGITRSYSISANQAGVFGFEYIAGVSCWVLFSAYTTGT